VNGDTSGGFGEFKPDPSVDPIAVLLERIKANTTIAYEKASIEALAKLKVHDLGHYIAVFAQLKLIDGLSIGPLRQAIEKAERVLLAGKGGEPRTAEDILLTIVRNYSGFCDGETVYFDVDVDEHRETLRAGDRRLVAHVRSHFLELTRQAITSDTIKTVIDTVADRILMRGEQRSVFCRVGADNDGNIYLDLGHTDGTYVQVTPDGWEVYARPALGPDASTDQDIPVRFARLRNAMALPIPERDGSIEEFRRFLVQRKNDPDDARTFILSVGWQLGALNPSGPYPGCGIGGPPGAGKTTFMRQMRRMVDPGKAMARSAPTSERDLMISSQRQHLQSFDNLAKISQPLSDAFCRLSTGGGLATRQLYSDDEEKVFEACRPILATSIVDVVTRPDLADRFIVLLLPERSGVDRRSDDDVEADFVEACPRILGALLTAVSIGLGRLPTMRPPPDLPRMAGFAVWVAACEPGLGWSEGTFLQAYRENIRLAADTVVDTDSVASVIIKWIDGFPAGQPVWEGSAGDLLAHLNAIAGHSAQQKKSWPRSPRGLTNKFRTLAPVLRRLGVRVESARILDGRPQWRAWRETPATSEGAQC
jgi:hypothetical protein